MKKVFFTTQGETPGYSPEFLGRNGGGKMIGILISHAIGNMARLWPIRKNGVEGRAMLSIPVQEIPALIEALQAFHDQHAPAPTPVPDTPEPVVDGSKVLILEVGRKYWDRNKEIVTIESMLRESKSKFPYFGRVEGEKMCRCYTATGQWGIDPGSGWDLVAEYTPDTEIVPHNEYLPHTEPINT